MIRLGCLLFIFAISEQVFAKEERKSGFVQPLDFEPIFDSDEAGISPLASSPIAAAMLKVDKSQYPQLFDTVVSSSIDSIQRRLAPRENIFSAKTFGFHPIASKGFYKPERPAHLILQPGYQQQRAPVYLPPLRYDIETVHDLNYKSYKPGDVEQGEEILEALKKNPSVSAYFTPAQTNVVVAHPLNYRKEELLTNPEVKQNYKLNYLAGSSRIRRYAGDRKMENLRKTSDEEDDPYDYRSEYISRPKAFDSEAYNAYTTAKDPNKDYEYPYGSGYDHKEYERIKELSEKQAAEIRQNPGNCKEVKKEDMTCYVCKDPKTGGNYESCSYVAEPKNNKYAYSKEKKFNSNDEPEEPENKQSSHQPKKSTKYEESKENDKSSQESKSSASEHETHGDYTKEDDGSGENEKYKAYYTHSSKPTLSEAQRAAESESSEEKTHSLVKPYNYKQVLPVFYPDNKQKKDVEYVLAEFKKKDRSTCKKVDKNGMTCYQCTDKSGLKNEECMFISESAPKRSHLAYQELKEFTSKPPSITEEENERAESQSVKRAPAAQRSAAYVIVNSDYGKKLRRKKAHQAVAAASLPRRVTLPETTATIPHPLVVSKKVKKRSIQSKAKAQVAITEETNIAPPEEFAGENSKGAFWTEIMPKYSTALGVTLPKFMLARSEHEASFDEVVTNT